MPRKLSPEKARSRPRKVANREPGGTRSGGRLRGRRGSRGGGHALGEEDARADAVVDDERYLVVDGRRWRRSDAAIPESFRAELVRELMSARRAVGAAKRTSDAKAEAVARERVQHAKVALGERGHAYWEQPNVAAQRQRAVATMHALLSARGEDKTICPSDVARTIGGEGWRSVMQLVREVAIELAEQGKLEVRQRGRVVSGSSAKGPIRLRKPSG